MQNWQLAKQDKQSEQGRVYYKEDVTEEDIEKTIIRLPFVACRQRLAISH